MSFEDNLEIVYKEHCFHAQNGNIEGVLATLHTNSPTYDQNP